MGVMRHMRASGWSAEPKEAPKTGSDVTPLPKRSPTWCPTPNGGCNAAPMGARGCPKSAARGPRCTRRSTTWPQQQDTRQALVYFWALCDPSLGTRAAS
eukprot:1648086-Pyramimonas_sp.AAC.1